jgi:hypothetical protein
MAPGAAEAAADKGRRSQDIQIIRQSVINAEAGNRGMDYGSEA